MIQRRASLAVVLVLAGLLVSNVSFAGETVVPVQTTGGSIVLDLIDDPDPVPSLWVRVISPFVRWYDMARALVER